MELTDSDVLARDLDFHRPWKLAPRWGVLAILTHRLLVENALLFDELITDARISGAALDPRCFVNASYPYRLVEDPEHRRRDEYDQEHQGRRRVPDAVPY
jgi:hypothetical protein